MVGHGLCPEPSDEDSARARAPPSLSTLPAAAWLCPNAVNAGKQRAGHEGSGLDELHGTFCRAAAALNLAKLGLGQRSVAKPRIRIRAGAACCMQPG